MAHAFEVLVLVSGASIEVYPNAGEMARQGLRRNSYAIWKSCEFVEFDRILGTVNDCEKKRGALGLPFLPRQ
jgi:hypothetical protein